MATGYEVKIRRPGARRGEELAITGLGVFKNGTTRLVTPDEAETFRVMNQHAVLDPSLEDGDEPRYVNELGPTVLQALEGSAWIVVEPVEMTKDDKGNWTRKGESSPDDPPEVNDPPEDNIQDELPTGGDE